MKTWFVRAQQVGGLLLALSLVLTAGSCSAPRYDVPRPVSQAWPRPAETALGQAYAAQLAAHPGQSGLMPLVSGIDAFGVRVALAEAAERTLDLQYYILRDDSSTQLLISRLLRAAQRGVRVRLLVDDLDALGKEIDLATLAGFANLEVRVFNPFSTRGSLGLLHVIEFLADDGRLNRRMHNKLWIADNAMAVIGGRNLGNEYFDASAIGNFTDFDVLTVGPVVSQISKSFDDYWNSELAVPIQAVVKTRPGPDALGAFELALQAKVQALRQTDYIRILRETRPAQALRTGQQALTFADAEVVYAPPPSASAAAADRTSAPIFAQRMRPKIEAARHEVILVSPYFIPSEQGTAALAALVQRGIRVRVLTNSLASAEFPPLAQAGYARLRPRLLTAGIELHELRPDASVGSPRRRTGLSSAGSLHAKAVVIDRRHVVVGSMNLDPRSRQTNTEVAVLFDSTSLGAEIGRMFDEAASPRHAFRVSLVDPRASATSLRWTTEQDGVTITYDTEPLTSAWLRALQGLLGAIAPEELL